MSERIEALESSAAHLSSLVRGLALEQLDDQSYASQWSIAQVLSHLGSGAVIMRRGVDVTVSGEAVEDGLNQSVWDEWSAKAPEAKAADALVADRALLDRLDAVSDDDRASFQFSMGPMTLDFDRFLTMRLSEHVLHTWDIDVTIHPDAMLPDDAVPFVLDVLPMITGFVGQSDGNEGVVAIRTATPDRVFQLAVGPERLELALATDWAAEPADGDVELSSEESVRLVYGRLDPAHTSPSAAGPALDRLRKLFPGL